MKYITAILSGIFMFLAVSSLLGLAFLYIIPAAWWQIEFGTGLISGNVPCAIAAVIAAVVAIYTFKTSLCAKTGKLYRKAKKHKDIIAANNNNQQEYTSKVSST